MRRRRYNKLILVYKKREYEIYDKNLIEAVESYSDFIDIIENSSREGYLVILSKQIHIKKELILAKLIDAKKDCEWHLREIKSISRKYTGYYEDDAPNGIENRT